jgi:peptidoglycan hydrolase-like protein with peptidoglycan-binding domain
MRLFELDTRADKDIINLKPLINRDVIEFGVEGSNVKLYQRALQSVGITPGPIDGKFGRQTKAATIVFQNSVHIEPDGIAGPKTLRNLQDVLDGKRELKIAPKSDDSTIKVKDLPNPENAKTIFEKFKDEGFNDIQSAAWVGCITGESGNNPNAVGPEINKKTGERYNSYGLCQWNKGRFKNLQKFAKDKTGNPNGWRNNVSLQVDFVMWELDNWSNIMGSSTNPLSSITAHTNNLEKTLYNLIANFEKPANKELAFKKRLPYAKSALSNFGSVDIK